MDPKEAARATVVNFWLSKLPTSEKQSASTIIKNYFTNDPSNEKLHALQGFIHETFKKMDRSSIEVPLQTLYGDGKGGWLHRTGRVTKFSKDTEVYKAIRNVLMPVEIELQPMSTT